MARSNGDLIAKARQMAEDVGRRAATVAEAREMLGPRRARREALTQRRRVSGALEDVRVLDLTRLLPGGFCSLLLADLGADVSRSRTRHGRLRPLGAALLRRRGPPGAGHALGALPLAQPRQALDPPRPEVGRGPRGAAAPGRATSDVVLESFRPGVLDRLGVGYERCARRNPASSTARSPATARPGPTPQRAGHDMNYLGLTGLLGPDRRAAAGRRSSPPARSPTSAAAG